MFRIETTAAQPEYSVVVKFRSSEARLILEQFSEWLLGTPANNPVARFELASAIDVYGAVISFTLQCGKWQYGEWNLIGDVNYIEFAITHDQLGSKGIIIKSSTTPQLTWNMYGL